MNKEKLKHIQHKALELCWEIEKFPASHHQTHTSTLAANLHTEIRKLAEIPNDGTETDFPEIIETDD